MELMSVSLDKFYKFVHAVLQERIPEEIVGKITVAVCIYILLLSTLLFRIAHLKSFKAQIKKTQFYRLYSGWQRYSIYD